MVGELGVSENVRLAEELVSEALGLIADQPSTLDLKIASAALTEMRQAFSVFAPYSDAKKVTMFGSARTLPEDPLYLQARRLAEELAGHGWMTVTGAGPGIMQAGMEGAGQERSIGVSIRLPFESGANSIIADDDKHVSMKYFFTRKLMLVKESQAFACLPGGFGTLDETFELLTLTQTGKGVPVPIVLLEAPGDDYWHEIDRTVRSQLLPRGLVAPADVEMYTVTDSCADAVEHITRFYANYHSIRHVGSQLVVRLQHRPDDEQLDVLNSRFSHLPARGDIHRVGASRVERRDDDVPDLPRIAFEWGRRGYSDLVGLIRTVNAFVA